MQYYNNIKKFRFLLLFAGLILPALLIFTMDPSPNYTTRTALWLEQPIFLDTSQNNRVEVISGDAQNYADALTSLLSSREFTAQVVTELEKTGYLFSSTLKNNLIEQLYTSVKLNVVGQQLLLIDYEADDPAFAIATLKAVTKVFSDTIQQIFLNRGPAMIQYLQSQLDQAKSELDKAELEVLKNLNNPNLPQPAFDSNFISQEDLQSQILQETYNQAQDRYNTLRESLERLQIGFDNISNGRGTLVVTKGQPAVINANVFDFTSRLLIAVGVGLAGGSLIALLLLLVLTWTNTALEEPTYTAKLLDTTLVVELPFAKNSIAAKSSLLKLGELYRDRNTRRTLLIFLLGISLILFVTVLSYRQPFNAIVTPAIALLIFYIYRKPLFGFGLSLFLVFACEVYVSPDGFSSFTTIPLRNFNSFTTLSLSINPVELILIWTTFCVIFHNIRTGTFRFYRNANFWLVGLLALFIAFGYVWGIIYKQGDSKIAVVEIRALIHLVGVYFLGTFFLSDQRTWKMLDWLIPASLTLLSLTTFIRFFILSDIPDSELYQESLSGFNHENAIFFVILVMWCINKLVFGKNLAEKLSGSLLIGLPIFGIMVSGRRAAFACLVACLIVFLVILFIRQRKAFFFTAIILLIIVPSYIVIFSNASGPLGLAARAFNSSTAPVGSRDYNSDLYRLIEKYNVLLTIREAPLTGKGFGQEFTRYIPIINLDNFALQYYSAHIQVLWLWLKVGLGGWIVFWLLICGSLFRLGQIVKSKREFQGVDLAVTIGCAITAIMVYAYLDLSLINIRLMDLLGVSIGLLEFGYLKVRQPIYKTTLAVATTAIPKEVSAVN